MWQLNDGAWTLTKVLKHRNGPSFGAVISADGSVAAVAFKGVVVLYTTQDWEVSAEIVQPIGRVDQLFLSGYYLLTSAKDLLSVWDLTSLSLCWQVSANVSHIVPLPDKHFLAFVSRKSLTDAFLFGVRSAEPVACHKFVCAGEVRSACVVDEEVVVLTKEQELFTLSRDPPAPLATQDREHVDTATVFSGLLKMVTTLDLGKPEIRLPVGACLASSILGVPSNAMPPISTICADVLANFVPAK